jgi:hypothetical protein
MKRLTTAITLFLTLSIFDAAQVQAQSNDPAVVRKAIEKSLPLIDGVRLPFLEKTGCFSCHHNSIPAMALGAARDRGFKVGEQTAAEESKQILALVNAGREKLMQGDSFGGVQFTAGYTLAGLAANKQTPNKTTDVLARYLLGRQSADGRWTIPINRPPSESSDFTTTALAVRALQVYAPKNAQAEMEARVQRARAWLAKATPLDNEDLSFQLLGLAWAKADKQTILSAAKALLSQQRKDGGWGQHSSMASDAYATGQALVALRLAAELPVADRAYQRGVSYLLADQSENGSWLVLTRTIPLQKYFESGFPYGDNQWISVAASSWATMALTLTVEAPTNSVVNRSQ